MGKNKKVCSDCSKKKNIKEFGIRKNKNKTKKIYYKSFCRTCMSLRSIFWRDKNIEKYRKYQREYQKRLRLKK